jgi:L-aspartate oxidase
MHVPRYLVGFHPKRAPHWFTDVLIIGGGLAGLRAAMEIPDHQVALVVTKDRLQESNSHYAQGGIASVIDPEDRFEDHVADTLTAGGALCDQAVVDLVVREAPQRVAELVAWGTQFDVGEHGLELGREGGHSHQRIVHALGDATGREVMRAVIERVRRKQNLTVWEQAFTIDLLTDQGRCVGALIAQAGRPPILVWAKQTILATGGVGQVFRESTNPRVATGDGHAAAFRAGAEVRDMEFMQFHPTVLYIAGSARTLISEAVRGEGAHLLDSQGNRFMQDYDERLELAPRDIVSQAIVKQMARTQHPCVYLDLSHLDPSTVHQRFPGISQACRQFGLDMARDRIPVRPGAHYMLGGVIVNQDGGTSLPGLWAAGEVTSSGLHGANRLASNSLLEGLVFGRRAGQAAAAACETMPDDLQGCAIEHAPPPADMKGLDLIDIRNSLTSLMGREVGVERQREGLEEALQSIEQFARYALAQPFQDVAGWELQNLLIVGHLMARAAVVREESRGVHYRTDFPRLDDRHWCRHISFRRLDHGAISMEY